MEQTVKVFGKDSIQKATYDADEEWVVVEHDRNEISLSLENWKSLSTLADNTVYVEPNLNKIKKSSLQDLIADFKRAEHSYWSAIVENDVEKSIYHSHRLRSIMPKIQYKLENTAR